MYLLKRIEDGKYVARPGSEHSYTRNIEKAQTFSTKEAAERGKCGNEVVVQLESILSAPAG